MAKRSKKARSRVRSHVATPIERLRATVFVIGDGARTKPPNRLIGDTPAETIGRCKSIVDWLQHIEQPFADGELAAAEAYILSTVVDALNHAEGESQALWAAAKGMAPAAAVPGA